MWMNNQDEPKTVVFPYKYFDVLWTNDYPVFGIAFVYTSRTQMSKFCLRLIAEWQLIDDKPIGSLDSILANQECPKTLHMTEAQHSHLAGKKCKIFVLRATEGKKSMKNFFAYYNGKKLFRYEKESIYWRIRLRYTSEIIPAAVIHMIEALRNRGYTDWILPDSVTIPLDELRLITFSAIPNNINVVKTVTTTNRVVIDETSETIESLGAHNGVGLPIEHSFLGAILPSGDKFVIDPTSLQFGMRGNKKELVYVGNWENYLRLFPGTDITLKTNDEWEKWDYEHARLYKPGEINFGYVNELAENTLLNLCNNACHFCGQLLASAPSNYLACKKSMYCDKICLKSDFLFHVNYCNDTH